ncbi:cytochrome c-type biogenesis protein CcmH [Luteibacter rhizovicinus]|uniref:Cytochrome c-type biogenesis protein CcmH n=1 Tax=Luteibacter rhizovicinus TaxID=242606 RepID=A0A4R3YWN5_9GAMM|nr:tetratricopeptide repeat protein [Luteibacter rhizovicinus]TCV97537.1 cytochrome c-type biogenesis protein CcmH [Luteibacter rhizovicinus]
MKFAFYAAAAVMLVIALALLLVPLIRQGRQSGRSRGVFAIVLAIAFVVPLGAIGLYALVGTPATLGGVEKPAQISIPQAIAELRQRLAEQPGDVQGWLLLGQTYGMLKQPSDARDAYDGALKADANNTVAMVGWAEADSLVRPDHRIDGRSRELLERAVAADPQSQRGLWLLGISNFQMGRYAEASALWKKLQPMLDPDSGVAQAVAEQIAQADARAGGATAPAASTSSNTSSRAQLHVEVALAPALKAKLAPGDTLYIFARAENGPPMPLAVAKLPAASLPASVTLTDGMGMTPQFTLSSAPRVFVAARISRNGQAIAQTGDLEGDAGVVDTARTEPVKIVIDRTH